MLWVETNCCFLCDFFNISIFLLCGMFCSLDDGMKL
jgi:hypothetical protein